jgi:hypothetical protein
MRLVQRHLVGEPCGALRHDAELRDLAQIMVAQVIQILAMIAHPQFRQRLGVGKRTVEQPRHELGDLGDERQFVAGGDARVGGEGLLQQRGAGAGKAEHEYRLRDIGASPGARQRRAGASR